MFDARLTQVRGIPAERVPEFDTFLHRFAARGGGLLGVSEVRCLLDISERDAIRVLMNCVNLSVLVLLKESGGLYFKVPAYRPDTATQRDVLQTYRDLFRSSPE